MMKNTIYTFIISLFLFSACDKIEMPYAQEDTSFFEDNFPPLNYSSVYRKILIEEYTGHRCTNCPAGHIKLVELSALFGDTLVPICIHATELAKPVGSLYSYDFRTSEGTELSNDFGINPIPAAVVNRTKFSGNNWALVGEEKWYNVIKNANRHVYAGIQIMTEEEASRVLKINTKTTMLETYNSPLQVSIFLIEDNIIKPQLNGTEPDTLYQHNHVFRTSLNGTYGTKINLAKDSAFLKGYYLDFKGKDWNIKNVSVVVILHDPATREVLQVEVKKQ